MADDVVIRAQGLGKKYVIEHAAERERYLALRDVIARNARNLQRSAVDLVRGRPMVAGDAVEEFWALRNVGFEVRRGEVVGVIGRNGAGKSTLLKVLSRITEPTEGRVEIKGRVASLLEVGTGFHPELSGRENIYLNGAILGMSRAEIRRKFAEIVAFAEVETFLDTPVKRYSSGMYVRLAFAVAAHLEPEILIVDEVLAVGDAEFQKKSLGKMEEVAGRGRTVLFVSHNMASIRALASKALLLEHGSLCRSGPVAEVISAYLEQASESRLVYTQTKPSYRPSVRRARIHQPGADAPLTGAFRIDRETLLEVSLEKAADKAASVNVHIYDSLGELRFHFSDEFEGESVLKSSSRECVFPAYTFNSGAYYANLVVLERNVQIFEEVENAVSFRVERAGKVFDRTSGEWKGTNGPGLFRWYPI